MVVLALFVIDMRLRFRARRFSILVQIALPRDSVLRANQADARKLLGLLLAKQLLLALEVLATLLLLFLLPAVVALVRQALGVELETCRYMSIGEQLLEARMDRS